MELENWIEAELVPDPDATHELGPGPLPLTDTEVSGSRLLIVQRSSTTLTSVTGDAFGIIELACTFHPAPGTRFTYASLTLSLTQPEEARFLDIEPKTIQSPEPVRFVVDDKGKIGIGLGKATASGETGRQHEYTSYHCLIQGSGAGTARAHWTFREDPTRQQGIGADYTLILTTVPAGNLTGYLQVSATLAKDSAGPRSLREMVIGNPGIKRRLGFQLSIPSESLQQPSTRFRHLELP